MLINRPATRMILAVVVGFAGLLATVTVAANEGSALVALAGTAITLAAAVGCFLAPALTVLVCAVTFAGVGGILGSDLLAVVGVVYAAAFAAYFGRRLRPVQLRQPVDR